MNVSCTQSRKTSTNGRTSTGMPQVEQRTDEPHNNQLE